MKIARATVPQVQSSNSRKLIRAIEPFAITSKIMNDFMFRLNRGEIEL